MGEFIGYLVSLLIAVGFLTLIFWLGKKIIQGKLREQKKWRDCRRWAKAMDYPIPKKTGVFGGYLVFILLLLGVVPGLIVGFMFWRRDLQSDKEMKEIMIKWIDAGKPLPPSKAS